MEVKVKHLMYPILIQPTSIKELKIIEEMNDGIKIGASVTLVEMESALRHQINTKHGKNLVVKSFVFNSYFVLSVIF